MDTVAVVAIGITLAALATVTLLVVRGRRLSAGVDRLEHSLAEAMKEVARLAGAIHTAPMGVVLTDDAGVIAVANPEAGRFLGSRPGEPVAEGRVRQAIEEAVLTRRAVEREVEIYTPVRTVIEVSAVPLGLDGGSAGAAAFIVDVTESRRILAMRRDFIANVSHELRTPLAALAVLAETLADGVDDPVTTAALAKRVQAEAHRLSNLIDDILDLSQAEADEIHDRPVSIGTLIHEVAAEVAAIASDRGVTLQVSPIADDLLVSGDRRQLRVMMANLVENAIKYSKPADPGGAAEVRVEVSAAGDRVHIDVTDEGIGIPAEQVDRIFERFYRVDRGRSRESGGTGLGLSIVRHIARTHRGEVTARSVEGEGSTFTVDLPRWKTG